MTCTPHPTMALSRSGGAAYRIAYVSLPRKYRPLTKAKTSPSIAPRRDRNSRASANCALSDRICLARVPEQFAGESRKTRGISDQVQLQVQLQVQVQLPAQQHPTDGEASADRGEQDEIAFLQSTGADGVVQRERNGRGGRVAESIDVDDDLRGIDAELLARGLDDAAVCLMRHEQIDVVRVQLIAIDQAARNFFGLAHGELEHRPAVLLAVVQPLIDRFVR